MKAAFSKAEIESEVASRFSTAFQPHEKRPSEVIPTGIVEIDSFALGGFPRGAITEVFGPASSGRTSVMLSAFTRATNNEEICALVDTSNSFDPGSAARAGMNCERLLWIRCDRNLEHAFKATDLLLQGGGFGLVLLDLGDIPASSARRIISSWWYRFRRTLEPTPTALLVIAEDSCVRSCATLALQLKPQNPFWSSDNERFREAGNGSFCPAPLTFPTPATVAAYQSPVNKSSLPHTTLLRGFSFQVQCQRPLHLNRRAGHIVCKANC
jgi:recombination protein RecA